MANTLAAELILDISKFRKGIIDAQNATRGAFSGFGPNAFSKLALGLIGAVTAAATIAAHAAGKIIAEGIQRAGEYERIQMRFDILTGSREAGNSALLKLREDALRTGVALEDMTDNVSKFMAFGFSTTEATKLNQGILDVGGSVGLTTRDMKLLGLALSQVAAKGVANMEELRQQIAEKGIPIFKALEQQLGVTGAQLSQMIQEGKVSSADVLNMFTGVVDGEGPFARFQGGAERMATTFMGYVDRIRVAWHEFLRIFGSPLIDALKPALDALLSGMGMALLSADDLGQAVADVVSMAIAIGDVLAGTPWQTFADLFKNAFLLAVQSVGALLLGTITGAGRAFQEIFKGDPAGSFTKGFAEGTAVFADGIAGAMVGIGVEAGTIMGKVRDRFEQLMLQQRARTASRNRTGADFSDAGFGAGAAGSAGAGSVALNGALSQAINVIAGRSAFAVIASSAQRSEALQERMLEEQKQQRKTLSEIEKNTRSRPAATLPASRTGGDMSRFA